MDEKRTLPELLRVHEDLGSSPGEITSAWQEASEQEKRDVLDDRLMEALLVDVLAGKVNVRRKSQVAWRVLCAAAAVLVVFCGVWWLLYSAEAYPRPRISGDFTAFSASGKNISGEYFSRGDILVAGAEGAAFSVGDHCNLTLAPSAAIVWLGERRKEVVGLRVGEVTSRVVSNKGTFTLRTPRGALETPGAEFATRLDYLTSLGSGKELSGPKKPVVITVVALSGAVACNLDNFSGVLDAGTSGTFAFAGGDHRDTLSTRHASGGPEAELSDFFRRVFRLVRKGVETRTAHETGGLPSALVGTLVELVLKKVEANGVAESMRGFQGTLVGTLVEKEGGRLVVKADIILKAFGDSKAEPSQGVVGFDVPISTSRRHLASKACEEMISELQVGARITVTVSYSEADGILYWQTLVQVRGKHRDKDTPSKRNPISRV